MQKEKEADDGFVTKRALVLYCSDCSDNRAVEVGFLENRLEVVCIKCRTVILRITEENVGEIFEEARQKDPGVN